MSLTISTLNLQNYLEPPNAYYDFEQIYSAEQWDKKNDWIKNYLNTYQPDIIAFQEVFSEESLNKLVRNNGYQYFGVLDKPNVEDEFIYSNPVVAIASKLPIKSLSLVDYNENVIEQLGLSATIPLVKRVLRATIELPVVGDTDFYIVHFKSKRSLLSIDREKLLSEEDNFCEYFKINAAGKWGSSLHRGSEAVLLQYEMLSRRQRLGNPMVLLGDFNDKLSCSLLEGLIDNDVYEKSFKHNKYLIDKYSLKDSWDMYISNTSVDSPNLRANTHYFGGKGSVLDYILMSNEFDSKNDHSIYEIIDYKTLDTHLINPKFSIDGYSTDHAIVQIELKLRT